MIYTYIALVLFGILVAWVWFKLWKKIIGGGIFWRCYGQQGGTEVKRDICEGEHPPQTSPDWCPRVKKMGLL